MNDASDAVPAGPLEKPQRTLAQRERTLRGAFYPVFKYCSTVPDDPKMTLDLPTPDKTRLAAAPLDVVVCQLRYDNNLAVSETRVARALHDGLGGRRGRYPRVEQVQTQSVSVGLVEGAPQAISASPASGWRFSSADGTWIVSVLAEHVSVETTAYQTWADFRERLAEVLRLVAEHLDPAFEQRLGLRYIDRLVDKSVATPSDWSRIVVGELLGPVLHAGLGPAVRASQQHLLLDLDEAGAVQCTVRHGLSNLPGDEPSYTLDYDVHRDGTRSFDIEDTLDAADAFNEYALQLFQASITPEHWEALK